MKRNVTLPKTEELIPEIISAFRHFSKKTGPNTHLQTREFREAVKDIISLEEHAKNPKETGVEFYTKERTESSLLYHFIRHYQEALSVLNELNTIPHKVLDLGSGPGPFALAALKRGAQEAFIADANPYALQIGTHLIGHLGYPISARPWTFPRTHLDSTILEKAPFDLIALSHSFREIAKSEEEQERLLKLCGKLLSEKGVIVFIDSSDAVTNKTFLQLRNRFQEEKRKILAPCIWTGSCPALESKVPCFAQRPFEKTELLGQIQRSADINLSSLKFSYLIVQYHQKAEEMPKQPLYRVVSPALTIHNEKRYMLCGVEGKRLIGTKLAEVPKSCRAFEFLERGAVVEVQKSKGEKEFFDLDESSSVKVIAAPGKPLPETFSAE